MDDTALAPIAIASGGLRAVLLRLGARLADLRAPSGRPIVLGYADPRDHLRRADLYCGAVIGRFANRIAWGRARVDGVPIDLEVNAPPHHVHGGRAGFSDRVWTLERHEADRAAFALDSPDGEGGYPGRLDARATYAIGEDALTLTLEARTDAPTLANLCHHPYFNLDGAADAGGHRLRIDAARYLPCDGDVLPTGEVAPVAGTAFDFRAERAVAPMPPPGANNTYCLSDGPWRPLTLAAALRAPGGPRLEVWTTQPGLHLYDGYRLVDHEGGLDGRRHGPRAGICLEAQGWPDSPGNPHFPQAVLRPGQTYRQVTRYRLA